MATAVMILLQKLSLSVQFQLYWNYLQFFFFFLNLHNTKHENNTAATNMWSSDYISQKTDNQVLGNKNSEHTNQREALISEGIIKTETILQHICGHSIATSGYLRYEFTGLSRFLKIRLSRKPKLF